MIKSFGVGNFKSFRDYQEVDLRQLNLIFGPNNHGKSSFTQALSMLIEILKNPLEDISLRYGGHDKIANDKSKPLEFRVRIEYQFSIPTSPDPTIDEDDPNVIESSAGTNYTSIVYCNFLVFNTIQYVEFFEEKRKCDGTDFYNLNRNEAEDENDFSIVNKYISNFRIEDDIILIDLNSNSDFLKYFSSPNQNHEKCSSILNGGRYTIPRFNKIHEHAILSKQRLLQPFLSDELKGIDIVSKCMRSIFDHMSNLIIHNSEFYVHSILNRVDTIYNSNFYMDFLNSDYYEIPRVKDANIISRFFRYTHLDYINEYLKSMGIDLSLILVDIKHPALPSSKVIRFVGEDDSILLHFSQLGSSIKSLITSILCLETTRGHIVVLEEPERNLHPALAAKFGKALVSQSQYKYHEATIPDFHAGVTPMHYLKNITLVETHSEHIIKAIQLEVARFAASKGQAGVDRRSINVLYFRKDEKTGSSTVRRIELDEFGSFTEPWPDDFFDAGADLTMERLRLMNRN